MLSILLTMYILSSFAGRHKNPWSKSSCCMQSVCRLLCWCHNHHRMSPHMYVSAHKINFVLYLELLNGWICKWARWGKSCVLIWYPIGQGPSCPFGISCIGLTRKSSFFGHIINPLLARLLHSRWLLKIGPSFLRFRGVEFVLVHKNATINIQPSWTHTWVIMHVYCSKNLHPTMLLFFPGILAVI